MEYFAIAIVALMITFALASVIDYCFFNNRFKLGSEFKRAFDLVGPIMMAITGIISFVPLIALVLENTITPLYKMMGLDPSMAVTGILAMDMGGFQLAKEVALDPLIGEWAGMVYGSMMGATIVFLIPVGLAAIRKVDNELFYKGILFGICSIPFGTFVGGVMIGIPVLLVLKNLIIPVIFSIIIVLCIIYIPNVIINVFKWLSIFIDKFAICALGIAIFKDFVLVPISATGVFNIENVAFFNMIAPTSEGVLVAGNIGLVLCGTLPFVYVFTKMLKKPLSKIAQKGGFTEVGITSFITTSANSMGMFPQLEMMNEKEKVMNVAFAVCASWVIGDHLAFAAANGPHLIAPMMAAKLVSGIISILLVVLFTNKRKVEG